MLLKGAHALIVCAGGVLLAIVNTATIVGWVDWLTQDELLEDPHDFVATHIRTRSDFALTLFDSLVIALIWHEYRLVRRHLAGR
jgi:uncharacterized membrane protein